jgi:hypothetical protein
MSLLKHILSLFLIDIPQSGCLCEVCENAVYIAKAMDNFGKESNDLVEFYSCNLNNQGCMEGECNACSMPIK